MGDVISSSIRRDAMSNNSSSSSSINIINKAAKEVEEGKKNIRLYEEESTKKIKIASILTFLTTAAVLGSVPFMIRSVNTRRKMARQYQNRNNDFRKRVNKERENMRRFMSERERARKDGYTSYRSQFSSNLLRSTMKKGRAHYERLGLDPSKPLLRSDLKAAFQTKAMKWHPDRLPLHVSDSKKRKEHEERFKKINASYEYLLKSIS